MGIVCIKGVLWCCRPDQPDTAPKFKTSYKMTSLGDFGDIKKGCTGFYIWRIEKMQVVPFPLESYGKFYNGDAFIIYCCTEYGDHGGTHQKSKAHRGSNIEQHIHFWLGEDASQDEVTTAAYKTVELDNMLGGAPIQHREVQGHESGRFLSYFKSGLRIMQGGVSTGLYHVTNDRVAKLFMVKGRRQPIVKQMKSVTWSEMNRGDVFVIDCNEAIFIWQGQASNRLEQLQASKLAQSLKSERPTVEVCRVIDGQENDLPDGEREVFNQYLPLKNKKVKEPTKDEDDKYEMTTRKVIKLYVCSDNKGSLHITEVKNGPLHQRDLNSDDSFIIDNGIQGIWVWVGKRSSTNERAEAMRNAQGFINKKGYRPSTPVTRVIDGGEPHEFKSLFNSWTDKYESSTLRLTRKPSRQTIQTKLDASVLHERPEVAADTGMVDDGSGAKEVFRVDHFQLEQVSEEDHGKFYSGDCYVVLYAYHANGRDNYIIYFWLGGRSSQNERGTAALKTVELGDRLQGKAVQVRVVQGKEPPHFLAIFQGKLRVYQGDKYPSARNGKLENDDADYSGDVQLFQVHGSTPQTTYAVQVPSVATSLNTYDCFVLSHSKDCIVWYGKGSTGDEREITKIVATSLAPRLEPTLMFEGMENDQFWKLLGGKKPYQDEAVFNNGKSIDHRTPRLFHCSNASGSFRVEEILAFGQRDLIPEDIMMLDVGKSIFLWIGRESNEEERRLTLTMSADYLNTDPSGRDVDIPVISVKQGCEPPTFTGHFGAWDPRMWDNNIN